MTNEPETTTTNLPPVKSNVVSLSDFKTQRANSSEVFAAQEAEETEDTNDMTPSDIRRRNSINIVCQTYGQEIYFKLAGMGFNIFSPEFEKDFEFFVEALHSALLRTYKTYHPIQDYVDENFQLVSMEEFNKMGLNANTA